MKKYIPALICLAIAVVTSASAQSQEPQAKKSSESFDIFTTIAPLYFATSQILGSSSGITNSCPPEQDAANYRPDRKVLKAMLNSDLIIINGASFEGWLSQVSLPKSKILNTAGGFKNEWLAYDDGKLHAHGDREMHSHHGINGHTWLATQYYKQQCTTIYMQLDEMLEKAKKPRDEIKKNYDTLMQRLSELENEANVAFAPLKGYTVAATHPSYDYLAVQHDFFVFNTNIDPDSTDINEELISTLSDLKSTAKERNIKYLFWESEPSDALANEIQKLGLVNVVFAPLESMDTPDYISGMRDNFQNLQDVLQKK